MANKLKRTYEFTGHRGFTLIEIMIVTAIIAATITLAMPYMNNRNSQTRSFLHKMTVVSRELHTKAKLQGMTYRLVFDMPEIQDPRKPPEQKIWVEKSNSKAVLNDKEEEATLERMKETDPKRQADPKGFERDEGLTKRLPEMPFGLRIDQIELSRLKNPVKAGRAFIHYLPQGLTDEAAIHIKGEGTAAWTIAIHPLTGRAELVQKSLSLKDIKSQ